jgi:hypothetical protein
MTSDTVRTQAIVVAFLGRQSDVLHTVFGRDHYTTLSPPQKRRLTSAIENAFRVYPEATGTFTVYSNTERTETASQYRVDTMYAPETCTCKDFLYRCDPSEGDRCKHIWRVVLLQRLDALPARNIAPYDWLLDELNRQRTLLHAVGASELPTNTISRINTLYSTTDESEPRAIQLEHVCISLAELLEAVQRA